MTPLAKRLPRELRHNLGKYLGIFLLMCGCVALTSGFLLAAHSITVIIDGMRDEYAIEDGRFATSFEATEAQLAAAPFAPMPTARRSTLPPTARAASPRPTTRWPSTASLPPTTTCPSGTG